MSADGTWLLTMNTPMGAQKSKLVVAEMGAQMETPDGKMEDVIDYKREGDKLKWMVQVKSPMPLKLHFDVEVAGDALTGTFRPGMFPPGKLSGVRA